MTARSHGMVTALAVVIILNFADWALTMDAVLYGLATEANPIMAPFVAAGPWATLAVKAAVIAPGCLAIWLFRDRRVIRCCAWVVTGCCLAVFVWHILARLLAFPPM